MIYLKQKNEIVETLELMDSESFKEQFLDILDSIRKCDETSYGGKYLLGKYGMFLEVQLQMFIGKGFKDRIIRTFRYTNYIVMQTSDELVIIPIDKNIILQIIRNDNHESNIICDGCLVVPWKYLKLASDRDYNIHKEGKELTVETDKKE